MEKRPFSAWKCASGQSSFEPASSSWLLYAAAPSVIEGYSSLMVKIGDRRRIDEGPRHHASGGDGGSIDASPLDLVVSALGARAALPGPEMSLEVRPVMLVDGRWIAGGGDNAALVF